MLELFEHFGSAILAVSAVVLRRLFQILFFPLRMVGRFFRLIGRFAASSFRNVAGGQRYFTGRLARSLRTLFKTLFTHPASFFPVLFYYIGRGLRQYKKLARYLLLLGAPAAAAVLLLFTVRYYGSRALALRLTWQGEVLGYVHSENEYLQARQAAVERLTSGGGDRELAWDSLPEAEEFSELIPKNRFISVRDLSERLAARSTLKTVQACGVYIDGEFLCAVPNESDARRVFRTFLTENSVGDGEGITSFVEQIDYVQGLYPENDAVIWDARDLAELLASARENDVYYTVREGDTPVSVAEAYSLTLAQLGRLNPALAGADSLTPGARLLVYKADDYLTVKTVLTEISNVDTDYETVEIPTDVMYLGATRTVIDGVKGYDQVTKLVTLVNGERVSEEEVSRITVKEPVPARVQVGTRALDSGYYQPPTSLGGILLWPAIGPDRINSDYEWRWGKLHAAIDIGSTVGTSLGKTVIAAAEGTVVISGVHSSYGYYVRIDHGNGMETLYAHCLENSLLVNVGDHVYAGQPIAQVGQTGFATGPHLHFEVIINGSRVDPKPYLGLTR